MINFMEKQNMVHCYKLGGLNIVLDICSGSVHVVDDVVYDIIEMYENVEKEEIIEKILTKYASDEEVTREEMAPEPAVPWVSRVRPKNGVSAL